MSDLDDSHGGGEGKHGQARALVEAALRARKVGAADLADRLLDEAQRTDPEAVPTCSWSLSRVRRVPMMLMPWHQMIAKSS